MNQEEKRLYLIRTLLDEQPAYRDTQIPAEPAEQKRLLRSLVNVRMPGKSKMPRPFPLWVPQKKRHEIEMVTSAAAPIALHSGYPGRKTDKYHTGSRSVRRCGQSSASAAPRWKDWRR